jgi:hypothetical protein
MLAIILLIILTILYYCVRDNFKENFEASIYESKNCCVIKKKRLVPNFIYTYYKSEYCDNYHDNKLRTIKENELVDGNPFSMDQCVLPDTDEDTIFGSCRRMGGFECVDFVTKKDCELVNDNMLWDKKSCNHRIVRGSKYYQYS